MKCYTFLMGKLIEGIIISENDVETNQLTLGGSKGDRKRVLFSRDNPPEVKEGMIYRMEYLCKGLGECFLELVGVKEEKDDRVLIRINTLETYDSILETENSIFSGYWNILESEESLEEIKCTNIIISTTNDTNLTGTIQWEDGLVIMSPGGTVCIKTNSGGIYLLNYHKDKGLLLKPIIFE